MNPMLVVSEVGALEGNLVAAARTVNPGIPVLNLSKPDDGAFGTPAVPAWVESPGTTPPLTRLSRSFYAGLADDRRADSILCVGASAILHAESLDIGLPIIGIIPRGAIDFSKRRKKQRREFSEAAAAADLLLFDSLHEMDLAASHGSRTPHAALPLFGERADFLSADAKEPFVSIVVPHAWDSSRRNQIAELYRNSALAQCAGFDVISAESLYSAKDFAQSRGFPGTARYRFPKRTTHVLLAGDTRNHAALLAALEKNHSDRYVVDATVTNHDLAQRSRIDPMKVGQGSALFRKLHHLVAPLAHTDSVHTHHRENAAPILDGAGLLTHLSDVMHRPLPWWFEEGICEPSVREFDVFYSVAPVENRTDGARPMRIRAVSEEFGADDVVTVRLSANDGIFDRRSVAVQHMIKTGARPRYFYGESSTAPMEPATVDRLADLMRRLKRNGVRTGWFVRDLHWLSADADYSTSTDITPADRVERGLHEVRTMALVSDIFYAPSDRSVVMFEEFLSDHDVSAPPWRGLPPGVADYRALPGDPVESNGSIRLVYAGGYGDVYRMDTLVAALCQNTARPDVSWFVRSDDTPRLIDDLRRGARSVSTVDGASSSDDAFAMPAAHVDTDTAPAGHSIDNTDFLHFDPRSERYVGLALLDSDYAKDAFPLKLMSYLEKRIPVAVFDDMGVANLVRDHGLGIVCAREGFTVEGLIAQAEEYFTREIDWPRMLSEQSWASRMAAVRNALAGL